MATTPNMINLLEQIVENGGGEPSSYRNLGIYYEKAQPNSSKAVKYYSMASELGDRHSQWNLGSMYFRGANVTKDVCKGLNLLEKAALYMDPDLFHWENKARNSDPDSIIQWLQALIEVWDIYASNDVSEIKQDFEKALKYLEEAGESEQIIARRILRKSPQIFKIILAAQDILFHVYKLGVLGTTKDEVKSEYWKKKAIQNGHSEASSVAAFLKIQEKIQQNSNCNNSPTKCNFCNAVSEKLLRCSKCLTAFYCGKSCQKSDFVQVHYKKIIG